MRLTATLKRTWDGVVDGRGRRGRRKGEAEERSLTRGIVFVSQWFFCYLPGPLLTPTMFCRNIDKLEFSVSANSLSQISLETQQDDPREISVVVLSRVHANRDVCFWNIWSGVVRDSNLRRRAQFSRYYFSVHEPVARTLAAMFSASRTEFGSSKFEICGEMPCLLCMTTCRFTANGNIVRWVSILLFVRINSGALVCADVAGISILTHCQA